MVYVRVRFLKMSSKHDEDIETSSHRLAPLGSWTFLTLDEDGANSYSYILPELLLTDVLARKCELLNSVASQQMQLNDITQAAEKSFSQDSNLKAMKSYDSRVVPLRRRSNSHLIIQRRTSYIHHQNTLVRNLNNALIAAAQTQPPSLTAESTPSEATTSSSSSLPSTLTMPFNVLKGLVGSTNPKVPDSFQQLAEGSRTPAVSSKSEVILGDGCVGLANLGNTCYMSSALQCLSHTPLLRHFFLSGRYLSEINKSNPLGTGGIIAQEFAGLLKLLWNSNCHVVPTRFKKTLGKLKMQFSGNDQNDAQEFLAELLDMLHEDLNRVTEKKYVEALSDEEIDSMNLKEQAEDAWRRHIARNRSILVDLFQGQMCSKIACPSCSKVSRTYDPFMFLSVPLLPKQHQCKVYVTVVRRMLVVRRGGTRIVEEDRALESYREHRNPSRYCVTVPRLGDISDLKSEIYRLTNIPTKHMFVMVAKGRRVIKTVQEGDPLTEVAELGGNKCIVYEACKDIPFLSTISLSRFNNRRAAYRGTSIYEGENIGSVGYMDKIEYDAGTFWEGDVIVDIGSQYDEDKTAYWENGESVEESKHLYWPERLADFKVGMRVDAMDMRGQWFAGCVEEVRMFSPQQGTPLPSAAESKNTFSPKTRSNENDSSSCLEEYYVRIHFDNFSPLWDEWISEDDFLKGRISRVYSHSERKIKLLEISVVNRRLVSDPRQPVELFGVPSALICESVRSCRHALRILSEQSLRYMTEEEVIRYLDHERDPIVHKDYKPPFVVKLLSNVRPLATGRELEELRRNGEVTPNRKSHHHEASMQQDWEGTLFPDSAERPLCNLNHSRLLIAVDWVDPSPGLARNPRELHYEDHKDYLSAVFELNNHSKDKVKRESQVYRAPEAFSSFNGTPLNDVIDLHDCFKTFTNDEVLDEDTWYCGRCKTHRRGLMQASLYRLPDILVIHIKRFSMTARRKDKIRTKVVFPLVSLNMGEYLAPESSESSRNCIYDLYAVANHIGDMTRGHYTAFINCQIDSPADLKTGRSAAEVIDNPQNDSCSKGRWFLFDDDVVEEVPSSRVVSGAAYVLFYKRRKLTPSNIINLTT